MGLNALIYDDYIFKRLAKDKEELEFIRQNYTNLTYRIVALESAKVEALNRHDGLVSALKPRLLGIDNDISLLDGKFPKLESKIQELSTRIQQVDDTTMNWGEFKNLQAEVRSKQILAQDRLNKQLQQVRQEMSNKLVSIERQYAKQQPDLSLATTRSLAMLQQLSMFRAEVASLRKELQQIKQTQLSPQVPDNSVKQPIQQSAVDNLTCLVCGKKCDRKVELQGHLRWSNDEKHRRHRTPLAKAYDENNAGFIGKGSIEQGMEDGVNNEAVGVEGLDDALKTDETSMKSLEIKEKASKKQKKQKLHQKSNKSKELSTPLSEKNSGNK